jgi:hypothetical protein
MYVECGGRGWGSRPKRVIEDAGKGDGRKGQEKDAPDLLIGYSRKGYADEIESGRKMV